MRFVRLIHPVIFLTIAVASLRAESEIVVAIRYLQAQGTSHSHLYLYRDDGKLLRQLTKDNSGQDVAPIFSPDGAAIIFTREMPSNVREFWSIEPRGTGLKKLNAAPEWYEQAQSSPCFTDAQPEDSLPPSPTSSAAPSPTPPPNYQAPDGSVELVLREDPKDEEDEVDGPGHGKHFLLRDLKTGTETEFGKIPDFYGVFEILHENQTHDRRFLFEETLHLAFFALHLNSTDGDTSFALDLSGPRFVRLSPNWATPIPLPGESGFLTFTENRYVPIAGSTKTANCSYTEHWDAKLNRVRYARQKAAALCYGASMYRAAGTPSTITIRRSSQ